MSQIQVLNLEHLEQKAPPNILGINIRLPKEPAYAEYNQKVINTLQDMKANQLSRSIIKSTFYTLRRLNKETDLMNPEEVKLKIADWKIEKQSKQKHLNNYDYFCQTNQIYWETPSLRWDTKIPITPSFKQAEEIIAAAQTIHASHNL